MSDLNGKMTQSSTILKHKLSIQYRNLPQILSLSHTHGCLHTLSLSLTHSRINKYAFSLFLSLPPPTLSLTLVLSHTHTDTLSLTHTLFTHITRQHILFLLPHPTSTPHTHHNFFSYRNLR